MHGQSAIGWAEYLAQPEFWNRTLQNWQSEFLAVGLHGRILDLPASARLAGVETRWRAAPAKARSAADPNNR